jgi:hypothetical protein
MNKSVSLLVFLFTGLTGLFGQYQYTRLNHLYGLQYDKQAYTLDKSIHTQIRPLDGWQLDSVGISTQSNGLDYPYKKWFWRKLFNEHLIELESEDYALTINPLMHFEAGFGDAGQSNPYYTNSRGFNIDGRIGKQFTFNTHFLENQAFFPAYISNFVQQTSVVPGQGKGRDFGDGGYDFAWAGGEISYTPSRFFNFTLGQGRNFFGEGYRSMILSDAAFNYPFFRISTSFGRVKYVNLWSQMYDVRDAASPGGIHNKKFTSTHLLSININNRLNLSFFESIVVGDTAQQRGLDASFLNPVIFYRPIEFAVGSRIGNALLGTMASYKLKDGLQAYGQFVLDEFTLDALRASEGSWVNKFAWQLGVKQYDAFGVNGLFARVEWNSARPYTFSHRNVLTNYGHYGQALGHPWGANFSEWVFQAIYQYKRYEAEFQMNVGSIGLDTSGSNWGTNIYRSYVDREQDLGNEIGQGVSGTLINAKLRFAYLVNPASGLKLEAGVQHRNLSSNSNMPTSPFSSSEHTWFFVGLRTEFLNRYYDF